MQELAEQLACFVTKVAQARLALSTSCAASGHRVGQAVCGDGAARRSLDTLSHRSTRGQSETVLVTAGLTCSAALHPPVP